MRRQGRVARLLPPLSAAPEAAAVKKKKKKEREEAAAAAAHSSTAHAGPGRGAAPRPRSRPPPLSPTSPPHAAPPPRGLVLLPNFAKSARVPAALGGCSALRLASQPQRPREEEEEEEPPPPPQHQRHRIPAAWGESCFAVCNVSRTGEGSHFAEESSRW